jgi:hypothetical protein
MRWLFDNAVESLMPEVAVPAASIRRFASELRGTIDGKAPGRAANRAPLDDRRARRHAELDGLIAESRGLEVVPANVPYVWAHIETLRALRRGGYVGRWEVESSAHRSH